MKILLSLSVLLLGLCLAGQQSFAASESNINKAPSAQGGAFAKIIDDLPLMPGLTVVEDKDVLFLMGPKRIAQTTASGLVDVDDVYYFYEKSLPQLGWNRITPRLYERENETLHIEAKSSNADGVTIVQFSIEPKRP
jgi:hypothetical protein